MIFPCSVCLVYLERDKGSYLLLELVPFISFILCASEKFERACHVKSKCTLFETAQLVHFRLTTPGSDFSHLEKYKKFEI